MHSDVALILTALQPVAAWTQWFTRLLLGSLYPGAPFERKFLAMLLLEALLSTWNSPDKANRQNFKYVHLLSPQPSSTSCTMISRYLQLDLRLL